MELLNDEAQNLIDEIMNVLNGVPPKGQQLASQLARLVESMQQYAPGLKALQAEYATLVHSHLREAIPFHWNKNKALTQGLAMADDENFRKDVQQYHQLVAYSLMSDDNYKILKYWGFQFPFEKSQFGLARDQVDQIQDYIDVFQDHIERISNDLALTPKERKENEKYYSLLLGEFKNLHKYLLERSSSAS